MQEVSLDDGDSYTLYFGKYKGQNVVNVFEEDPAYIEWVYDNMELNGSLKIIIENLVTTGCPF